MGYVHKSGICVTISVLRFTYTHIYCYNLYCYNWNWKRLIIENNWYWISHKSIWFCYAIKETQQFEIQIEEPFANSKQQNK